MSRTVPDSDLILRCKDGDEDAFEALYHRYRLQLYSYLNRLLPGQQALVDDLFQEAWMKVLDGLPRYQHQYRFISWLFRIAHNLVIDYIRRESRLEDVPLDENLQVPAASPVPWQAMAESERRQQVASAIAELSAEQREVVLLRQQGVAFKDIAEIQRVSINTVLGRMHYAVKKLQRALGGPGPA